MIEYRTLENISYQTLFEIFQKCFTDSQTAKESSIESFQKMLEEQNYDPYLSIGAFDSETNSLVAFVLNCLIKNAQDTAYDILTGTLPEYRCQGIAQNILLNIKELFVRNNIHYYKTEVKQNNMPAIKLYASVGFKIKKEIATIINSKNGQRTIAQFEIEMELQQST